MSYVQRKKVNRIEHKMKNTTGSNEYKQNSMKILLLFFAKSMKILYNLNDESKFIGIAEEKCNISVCGIDVRSFQGS